MTQSSDQETKVVAEIAEIKAKLGQKKELKAQLIAAENRLAYLRATVFVVVVTTTFKKAGKEVALYGVSLETPPRVPKLMVYLRDPCTVMIRDNSANFGIPLTVGSEQQFEVSDTEDGTTHYVIRPFSSQEEATAWMVTQSTVNEISRTA